MSSDLLERYVLGNVTSDEKMKVELLCVEHRVIREKIKVLRLAMSQNNSDQKSKNPKGSRECIIKHMGNAKEVPKRPATSSFLSAWWKIAAALFAGGMLSWAFLQYQIYENQNALVEQAEEFAMLQGDHDLLTQLYSFINHTSTIPILLRGTSQAKESMVIVYWNEMVRKSLMRVVELPAIQADQTFQLWANVSGEMHSLGVFDASLAITDAISMDFISDATSLNITIEPKGGSQTPTITTLIASQGFQ